jgi:hypothetical protein
VRVFSTKTSFEYHLLHEHDSFTEAERIFLLRSQKRPSLFPFLYCHFCDTPEELDLRSVENLYEIRDDTYVYLEKSEKLQKHIGNHLRDLSMYALLELDSDSVESCSDSVGQVSHGRSDNLSYILLIKDVIDETGSTQWPVDDSYDAAIHDVPERYEVDWDHVPKIPYTAEDDPNLVKLAQGQGSDH